MMGIFKIVRNESAEAGAANGYDYAAFPRRFVSYRWFKPIFVLLLGAVLMLTACRESLVITKILHDQQIKEQDRNQYIRLK